MYNVITTILNSEIEFSTMFKVFSFNIFSEFLIVMEMGI